jgi:hypothetical protein
MKFDILTDRIVEDDFASAGCYHIDIKASTTRGVKRPSASFSQDQQSQFLYRFVK